MGTPRRLVVVFGLCALALFAIPRRAVAATIAERIFGEWRVVSLRVNDEEKPRRGEVSIVFQKNSIYIMYRLAGKRRSIIEGGAWSIYKAQLITVNHKHKTSTFSVRFDGENRLVLGFKTTKMTLARRKTSGREKPPSTKPLQIPTSR